MESHLVKELNEVITDPLHFKRISLSTPNRKIRMISGLSLDPLSREHHNRLNMQEIYQRKYLWKKWGGTSLTLREGERKGSKEVWVEAS